MLQQLLDRLSCFPVRPTVLPTVLSEHPEDQQEEVDEEAEPEPEPEAEPTEDLETEELMRSMAAKLTPAARFRWRRSRWLRYCPVALADGNLLPGKTEFTVSYDDILFFYLLYHFCLSPSPVFRSPTYFSCMQPVRQMIRISSGIAKAGCFVAQMLMYTA